MEMIGKLWKKYPPHTEAITGVLQIDNHTQFDMYTILYSPALL